MRGSTVRPGGGVLGGVAIAIAGLLAALALVYSNANGVAEVADQARTQQASESALGAAAAARNALGQVLILASGDLTEAATLAAWIDEAGLVLADLDQRIRLLTVDADPTGVAAAAATALDLSRRTLDLVADGDAEAAGTLATTETADAFDDLTDRLVAVRDAAAGAIASARLEAGDVATASRFMVAFFVPSLAIVAGIIVLRRRRRRERLAADLERERTLSRSKDQLIANLSHELRTPLTGIYTSALAIDELHGADGEIARELNTLIIDQSADLTRMVEDLLVSAQADAGRLAFTIAPTSIGGEVSAVIREFARSGATLEVHVADGLVAADPGRLRQVLRNLISNAVRHGGPTVRIQGAALQDGYLIQVIDDGPGIPAEIEDRLFERFVHQGDRPLIVGSVGLGLAITRVLAEGMGGSIGYRRNAGLTIFSLRLANAAERPAEVAA